MKIKNIKYGRLKLLLLMIITSGVLGYFLGVFLNSQNRPDRISSLILDFVDTARGDVEIVVSKGKISIRQID